MNTVENNKLIAEFMGIRFDPEKKKAFIDGEWRFNKVHYHTSWDWLMPVVEKINSLKDEFGNPYQFMIGNGYVWVDPHIGDRIFFSGNGVAHRTEPMISKTHSGVIAFIKWYNKNKQS